MAAALPLIAGESAFPLFGRNQAVSDAEPQEEYMLAKRWREHGDREAAHKLVTSHLRLVARSRWLPRLRPAIGESSPRAMCLMQAVRRFEPDKGFKLATYAMWWIRASIQEYILRSCRCEDGHDREPEEAVLQPAQGQEQNLRARDGDLRDDQVETIATRLASPSRKSST